MLAEVHRNCALKRICQTELCGNYDHKHQDSRPTTDQGPDAHVHRHRAEPHPHAGGRGHRLHGRPLPDAARAVHPHGRRTPSRRYHADAAINGLAFDRHDEEAMVAVFSEALRMACQRFLEDPLGAPLIPNWNRIAAAIPDFLDQLAHGRRRGLHRIRRDRERRGARHAAAHRHGPRRHAARSPRATLGPAGAVLERVRRRPASRSCCAPARPGRRSRRSSAAPRHRRAVHRRERRRASSRRSGYSTSVPRGRGGRQPPVRCWRWAALCRGGRDPARGRRAPSACSVVGFSDMTVGDVAEDCGLPLLDAQLAKLREFDEPFRLLDADPAARSRFLKALHRRGLRTVSGGRYRPRDRRHGQGAGGGVLRGCSCRSRHGPVVMVGLGDGLERRLDAAGCRSAVIVRNDTQTGPPGGCSARCPTARDDQLPAVRPAGPRRSRALLDAGAEAPASGGRDPGRGGA